MEKMKLTRRSFIKLTGLLPLFLPGISLPPTQQSIDFETGLVFPVSFPEESIIQKHNQIRRRRPIKKVWRELLHSTK